VTYEPQSSIDQASYFNFSKGKIKVINKNFSKINVIIKMNDFTDTCEVRLKQYPTAIKFDKASDYVNANSIYALDVKGVFSDLTRDCENGEFNYKIKSSNTSVIEVVSEDDLLVRSTGRRGFSQIEVSICNSKNVAMTGLKATINLNVVETIEDKFVSFGSDHILKQNQMTTIAMGANEQRELNVLYFSANGICNTYALSDFDVYLSSDNIFEIVKDQGKIYLKAKNLSETIGSDGYEVVLTIQTSALESDGEPCKMTFGIKVQISE